MAYNDSSILNELLHVHVEVSQVKLHIPPILHDYVHFIILL